MAFSEKRKSVGLAIKTFLKRSLKPLYLYEYRGIYYFILTILIAIFAGTLLYIKYEDESEKSKIPEVAVSQFEESTTKVLRELTDETRKISTSLQTLEAKLNENKNSIDRVEKKFSRNNESLTKESPLSWKEIDTHPALDSIRSNWPEFRDAISGIEVYEANSNSSKFFVVQSPQSIGLLMERASQKSKDNTISKLTAIVENYEIKLDSISAKLDQLKQKQNCSCKSEPKRNEFTESTPAPGRDEPLPEITVNKPNRLETIFRIGMLGFFLLLL